MQDTALQRAIDELLALNEFGRYAEMEERARSLAKSFPGVPLVNELLGMALAAQQRFADALPHLSRAVRDQPGDPFFWDNLAFCHLQLGELDAAERTLRDALAHHPNSMSAWGTLGNVLFVLGRFDEARGALDRVLAAQPGDPTAHFWLGQIALRQRHFADAERHLRATLAANPDIGAVHGELGMLQLWRLNLGEAEQSLRRAIALDPSNPGHRANLCRTLALLDRLEDASHEARILLDQLRADGGAV